MSTTTGLGAAENAEQRRANPLGLLAIVGLFALLWFGAGPGYFLVVVGLIAMIFLHELGHYMAARWTGMKVTQFFLFMGPRLWSFRRGETEYGIRLIPAGAFVRVVGMHNLDPCDRADEHRAYKNQSYPRRMFFITAGSMMHFIQAIVLFVLVFSVIGMHDSSKWSIGEISQVGNSDTVPAAAAGLKAGDDILAINGQDTTQWGDAVALIKQQPDEQVILTVERDGLTRDVVATLGSTNLAGQRVGVLGVTPTYERTRLSPLVGFEIFGGAMWQTAEALPGLFNPAMFYELGQLMFEGQAQSGLEAEEAQRPVSAIGIVRDAGQPDADITRPLISLATVNIFVGMFNLLPLLPLDGGHALIATYERVRSIRRYRYRADVAKAIIPTYFVLAALGFLFASTLYLDIVRPVSG